MKKRISAFLAIVLLFSLLFTLSASADTGPKPSVNIEFKGLEGRKYYVTLLAEDERLGPWGTDNEYEDRNGDKAAWDKFKSVSREDMYFIGYFEDCSETNSFTWSYYPPDEFYIAVYLPDSDELLISSEEFDSYAFDSYYGISVGKDGSMTVVSSEAQYFLKEALAFAARLVITIAIELAVAACFMRLTKKTVLIIVLIIVGEICWKKMPHYVEDDEEWDPNDHFELQEEEWNK